MMRLQLMIFCLAALAPFTIHAEELVRKVYLEQNGLVVMEIENTDSSLGSWQRIPKDAQGYPAGALGGGHLEAVGSETWGVPDSALQYQFRIRKPGIYFLRVRAHKRLEGEKGDKCNDCFIRMEGDFGSGDSELPLKALKTDQKLFGGAADAWGVVRMLDLKPKKFGIKDNRHLRTCFEIQFLARSSRRDIRLSMAM